MGASFTYIYSYFPAHLVWWCCNYSILYSWRVDLLFSFSLRRFCVFPQSLFIGAQFTIERAIVFLFHIGADISENMNVVGANFRFLMRNIAKYITWQASFWLYRADIAWCWHNDRSALCHWLSFIFKHIHRFRSNQMKLISIGSQCGINNTILDFFTFSTIQIWLASIRNNNSLLLLFLPSFSIRTVFNSFLFRFVDYDKEKYV